MYKLSSFYDLCLSLLVRMNGQNELTVWAFQVIYRVVVIDINMKYDEYKYEL